MRPLALLAVVLATLAPSPAVLASDPDLEPLQRKMSMELQRRIEEKAVRATAARVERQIERALARRAGAPPTRVRIGDGWAPARASAAGRAAPGPESPAARMTCQVSPEHDLECVVVSKRSKPERVAQVP